MNQAAVEKELCEAYHEEATHYQLALDLAGTHGNSTGAHDIADSTLQQIGDALALVSVIEQRIAPIKSLWQASDLRSGPDLQAALEEVGRLIQSLSRIFGDAEQAATRRQTALLPDLTRLVQGQKMRRAYGASLSQG
jgi:hypothetical protein